MSLRISFAIDPEKEFIVKLGGKMQNSSAKSETLRPIERDRRWKEKMENVTVQVLLSKDDLRFHGERTVNRFWGGLMDSVSLAPENSAKLREFV